MYNYIDAKGIKRLLNPELLDVDISNYKMKDLYAEFSGVFIRALDTLTNKEVIIDITNELENNINNPTVLDIWLKQQTSITNTISEYPTSINIATYGDAFHSCYNLETVPQLNTNKLRDMYYMFCNCCNNWCFFRCF